MQHENMPYVEIYNPSDDDNRRLVHLVAALREHIEDEVEWEPEDPTDPRSARLPRRHQLFLCAYLYHALTNVMLDTHAQEAERLDQGRTNPWVASIKRWDAWGRHDA